MDNPKDSNYLKPLTTALIITLLAGCISTSGSRDYNPNKAEMLEEGTTTQSHVRNALGAPKTQLNDIDTATTCQKLEDATLENTNSHCLPDGRYRLWYYEKLSKFDSSYLQIIPIFGFLTDKAIDAAQNNKKPETALFIFNEDDGVLVKQVINPYGVLSSTD